MLHGVFSLLIFYYKCDILIIEVMDYVMLGVSV